MSLQVSRYSRHLWRRNKNVWLRLNCVALFSLCIHDVSQLYRPFAICVIVLAVAAPHFVKTTKSSGVIAIAVSGDSLRKVHPISNLATRIHLIWLSKTNSGPSGDQIDRMCSDHTFPSLSAFRRHQHSSSSRPLACCTHYRVPWSRPAFFESAALFMCITTSLQPVGKPHYVHLDNYLSFTLAPMMMR